MFPISFFQRVILLLVTVGVVATMPNPQYGGGSYSGGGGSPSTGGGSGGAPAPNYASAGMYDTTH